MCYISFFGHTPNATFPLYLCNRFSISFVYASIAGRLHHGIHVFRFTEKIPEADQAQCEEASSAVLEAMVYPNPLRSQVR